MLMNGRKNICVGAEASLSIVAQSFSHIGIAFLFYSITESWRLSGQMVFEIDIGDDY